MNEPKKTTAKDIHDVGPSSLNHLVGVEKIVRQISMTLDYCFEEHVPYPHALMLGFAGAGKTQIARIIAQELCCGFHEVLSLSIRTLGDFYSTLLTAADGDIVFYDEIHSLDKRFQTVLLTAMTDRTIYLPSSAGNAPQAIKLANFAVIGATTHEFKIISALVDRFKQTLRFQYYSEAELVKIVHHRSNALGWGIQEDAVEGIAKRAKGVPRLALRLLQTCWRTCRAKGAHTITSDHLAHACDLEELDVLGLNADEQKYLTLLVNGPRRLNVLATSLGLPSRTVSESIEQFLIRHGLVTKDKYSRRVLTEKGRAHQSTVCSENVK